MSFGKTRKRLQQSWKIFDEVGENIGVLLNTILKLNSNIYVRQQSVEKSVWKFVEKKM